ncbi:MAG: SCO1664 family protein [Actinomycetota bacterium]
MTLTDEATLLGGQIELLGMLPGASNYTLLGRLIPAGGDPDKFLDAPLVVYKPRRGEAPLWDFPPGTLCQREVAAYLLAKAAGWDFVPPTVLREGPLGAGAVQAFIEHDPSITAFDMLPGRESELRQIAVFDMIANNADRKAGHVLLDDSGKIWGLDHGLCLNEEPKLRTVLWDFVGEPIPPADIEALARLCEFIEGEAPADLGAYISNREIRALQARVTEVLKDPVFPPPKTSRPYPWPPV